MPNRLDLLRFTDFKTALMRMGAMAETPPMPPTAFGDAHDVVAILFLNEESLTFLADELPQSDGYTRYIRASRDEVMRELAAWKKAAEDIERGSRNA